ncbi:glycogen synthase GlgA [Cupriavidus sp. D39]|uniref:glycogen synthase GlgA n=1 Tax=Cupriavidus sp. D39 TaxID=2997877 RepID=UPI00226F33A1|nr:glycogen synthase GlgA [Cupriavidus sp. D39]MCY0853246.1 glycogen synthase GlgA [Cupriavidus sp. D39]
MIPSMLFVAAEAIPLAKTGGLGDVVSGLARALQARGCDITILMPGYPDAIARAQDLRNLGGLRLPLDLPAGHGATRLLSGRLPGSSVKVVLLDCAALYDRGGSIYMDGAGRDFVDNPLRFATLSHAAAAVAAGRTALPIPDVVHAHDWHAALTPLLMQRAGVTVPSILTIHNLAFQGLCPLAMAPLLGLPDDCLGPDGMEFWGQLNFLKAGIRYANRVTTVSRAYAGEILTPRFGHGLDGLLQSRRDVLSAIPNGVDTHAWDPATDALLPQTYRVDALAGKRACKAALQQRLGLPADPFAPLVAQGSRLTHQKMADVALNAIEAVLAARPNVQFAILGCGDPRLEQGYRELAERHPARVGVAIGYREECAHLLHAGADILLHGSRFEPFGLTPVYAMRYGTVPVVSRVGGMIDTVRDAGDDLAAPTPGSTGFSFEGETAEDMTAALHRALHWFGHATPWHGLQSAGMRMPCGWDEPARGYLDIYSTLAPRRTPIVVQHAARLDGGPATCSTAQLAELPAGAMPAPGALPALPENVPRRQSQRRPARPLGDGLPAVTPA